jgi:hypothetical protein
VILAAREFNFGRDPATPRRRFDGERSTSRGVGIRTRSRNWIDDGVDHGLKLL